MKILTINTKFSGGGAAKIAYTIHKSINDTKSNESLFIAGYGEEKDKNCRKINKDIFKYLSALSFRVTANELNIVDDIEKYIVEADIIHIHNLHGYYVNYDKVFKLIIKYDKPIVWTLHDIWSFTGRCAIATKCEEWRYGCKKCNCKNLYPKSIRDKSSQTYQEKKRIFEKLNKDKTIIVTPSKWLMKLAKQSMLKEFKIINIPNGIRIDGNTNYDKSLLRKKYRIPIDRDVVLFIAANPNDELKGIKLLFKSMELLGDKIFISVGSKIKCNYKNLIQMGYIDSNEKMNEIYQLSDLYVNPSLSENFPTTNLEAFCNKTPVIGFRVGGVEEQLQGSCGIIVDNIDDIKLYKAIDKFFENKELNQFIIDNAYDKCLKNYSYDKFINDYMSLYNKLYNCNSRR